MERDVGMVAELDRVVDATKPECADAARALANQTR
jgi:hypothetical protein